MSASPPPRFTDTSRTVGRSLSGTNLERAGDHNQRVTLQAIRVHGPVTRTDLVNVTGLTPPAIANITKRLLSEQLIMEIGRQHGGRGQPAMRLAINPDGCYAIGVNIDRDHITVVGLDLMGKVRARKVREADLVSPEAVVAWVQADIQTILNDPELAEKRLIGIGFAIPDDLGRVSLPHWPSRYDAWKDTDIPSLFTTFLPAPIFVENDAAAAALGELQFGHGLHHPNFFYLLISGGLGGGLVIEGNYCRGANGRSGEIGFLPIRSERTPARTLQEVVSLSGLYDFLAAAGHVLSRPDQLLTLAKAGQLVLAQWMDIAVDVLVEPLIDINCLINPHAIYLGGQLPAVLVDELAERLNRRMADFIAAVPVIAPVHRAMMAADAPAIGAALLPFSHQLLPSHAAMVKAGLE